MTRRRNRCRTQKMDGYRDMGFQRYLTHNEMSVLKGHGKGRRGGTTSRYSMTSSAVGSPSRSDTHHRSTASPPSNVRSSTEEVTFLLCPGLDSNHSARGSVLRVGQGARVQEGVFVGGYLVTTPVRRKRTRTRRCTLHDMLRRASRHPTTHQPADYSLLVGST